MSKKTPWITISEETFHTPVSNTEKKPVVLKKSAQEPVKHKFFWSVGFVAVILLSFAMLAPKQFGTIIQGNLFDAPGVEAPTLNQSVVPLGVLPSGTPAVPEAEPETPASAAQDQTVVQPENTPVSIQVEPLEVAPKSELDANERLIEELKKQVEQLKVQNQAQQAVNNAAFNPALLPINPFNPLGQFLPDNLRGTAPEAAGVTATLGEMPPQGPYRVNLHRVTVHPQTVLQQNMAGGYRAQLPAFQGQISPTTTYRADLGRVQGTPDTGPREVMLFAFILTFVGLLGWKAIKISKS